MIGKPEAKSNQDAMTPLYDWSFSMLRIPKVFSNPFEIGTHQLLGVSYRAHTHKQELSAHPIRSLPGFHQFFVQSEPMLIEKTTGNPRSPSLSTPTPKHFYSLTSLPSYAIPSVGQLLEIKRQDNSFTWKREGVEVGLV